MATPADVIKMIKEKRGQVRRLSLHRHPRQGAARHGAGHGVRRGQVRARPRVRRLVDRRLEGHRGLGHAADAGSGHRQHRSVLRTRPTLILTCDVIEPADGKGYERDPRSLAKRAEAYLKSIGPRRHRLLRPRARVLHLRRASTGTSTCRAASEDRLRGSAWSSAREVRGRQHGPPPAGQGRLLPGAAGRFAAGHPLRDVPRARAAGRRSRSASPRSGRRRPEARSAPSSRRW